LSVSRLGYAAIALAIALTSCAKDEPDASRNLTQHEKDSILGASQIPGARAVKTSLTAADSAAARQARMDSTEREP
jgi:hypothetical protein